MSNLKQLSWLATAAALLLIGTSGLAQTSTTSESPKGAQATPSSQIGANNDSARTGGVQTSDRKFMDNAAQGGMAEVELGNLAQQNGQSQEVKDFGKKMVDDHSKANDQLKQLASQQGVSLPTDLDAKDKATKDHLSKLHGGAFDKAYMRDMVNDHKKDVAEFQHEANSGKEPQVKQWASQTLPTLQEHLKMAQDIEPKVAKGNTSNSQNMSAQQH